MRITEVKTAHQLRNALVEEQEWALKRHMKSASLYKIQKDIAWHGGYAGALRNVIDGLKTLVILQDGQPLVWTAPATESHE